MSVVHTENLVKKFRRVEALNGLNLDVLEGAVYALVGPNGAGKTTAIKILMNIFGPTSGRAEVLGVESARVAGRAFTSIGYVSENQELPDWMRVGTFLDYLRPFYPSWDRALEDRLIRQFDLPRERKLGNLSRGMRMKAALASSLAYHPKLIVLDEPFTGLDPLVRDELIQGLLEQAEQSTIFVSSHDLAEIESFASHVGYLEQGRLRFSEELEKLVQRFREAKSRRQIIIVTHNANLVVNTDADQVIVAQAGPHRPGMLPEITYDSGGLENPRIRQQVCAILEGGETAFKERAKRLRVKLS